jgi:hypothetical protein
LRIIVRPRYFASVDSPAPRRGLVFMIVIIIAIGFVALYANVQRLRRDKIETVTFTPAAAPSPSASPTP